MLVVSVTYARAKFTRLIPTQNIATTRTPLCNWLKKSIARLSATIFSFNTLIYNQCASNITFLQKNACTLRVCTSLTQHAHKLGKLNVRASGYVMREPILSRANYFLAFQSTIFLEMAFSFWWVWPERSCKVEY